MEGVLTGFAIIGTVIAVGYLIARFGLVPPEGRAVLTRIAFFVTTPALLFTVLARADVTVLFSSFLLVSLIAVAVVALLYVLASRLFFRRSLPETVIGTAASSYVNANNIGLPVAIYVLGDPQWVAPTLLLQLLLLAPTILTLLDVSTSGRASVRGILTQPLRNPMIIASALGLVVSVTGVQLPAPVLEPFSIIGNASIPLVLMAFGMSLRGQRPLEPGPGRVEVAVASLLKTLVMPATAYLLGRFAFALDAEHLFAVTVTAALPTAQNIFNFASRYDRGVAVARDTALVTTVTAVPVLIAVSLLLG
ncbi:AEC family transporter [Rathayibacter sp. VKM Ac-2760]|uniref:AEC family transporter n=1 Tax=Rathayibacter sp. VKM Ac-2760 TaxID=2609253 RepID=UPI00131774DC|nr:AEC family transporter [Rathayibacter sp. VKM Ac-2760]QHC57254.1 AEC family transporter [Rathayibacter sp. VKM Ac-2760]